MISSFFISSLLSIPLLYLLSFNLPGTLNYEEVLPGVAVSGVAVAVLTTGKINAAILSPLEWFGLGVWPDDPLMLVK